MKEDRMRKTTSFDEFDAELKEDAEYRKAKREIKPYYDLALEIIRRRVELGFTQNDLAERANTFQSRISKIESGEHDIRFSTLIDIAEALECEVAKIILVPVDATEYEPPKDNSGYFFVINSTVQTQSDSDYVKAEDYQKV
jgi:transcriptional regulator with XRE-family HTH domain